MNTMQQEFDAVVQHLYKQGRPAKGADGFCKYRGENGTMCAVGCRIPDALYDEGMDEQYVGGQLYSLIEYGFPLPDEITTYAAMFDSLQTAHDGAHLYGNGKFDMYNLAERLKEVASDYDLDFKEPKL